MTLGATRTGGGYLRNVVTQTAARILFMMTTLGSFVAVARLRGPEPLGQYAYAVTFATLFSMLADFGTGQILGKELQERRGKTDREFLGSFMLLRAAIAFALVPPALGIAHLLKPELFAPLALAAFAIPILSFRFFEPLYQVYDRPAHALPPAVFGALVYFGSTLAVVLSGGGVFGLLAAYVAGYAVYGVVAFRLARRSIRPAWVWRGDLVRSILVLSTPLGVSSIFTNLNSRVGTFLLAELRTDWDVGIYNAAFRFLDLAAMVGVLLVMPLIPIFARKALEDREGLKRDYQLLIEHLALVIVPGVVLLPFLSPFVIELCFGTEFAASAPVLNVLGVSAALIFFSLASSVVNLSLGVVRHGYWNGAVATALNVTLAWMLVPTLGARGAAWGALLGELGMLLISQYFTGTALGQVFRVGHWARLAGLGAALWLWLDAVPIPILVGAPLGLVLYGLAAWLLGLVAPQLLLRPPAPEARA